MIRRLLDQFKSHSRPGSLRDRLRPPVIPGWVEVLEQRIVLSATQFPFSDSVEPTPGFIHNITISDVTNDTAGNGILIGAGKNAPTFTITIDRGGDTTPTHQYQLDLISGGQVIATTGLRNAGTSSANLALVVGGGGLPTLPPGESDVTVRFNRPNFPVNGVTTSVNLATVTVRVNQVPATQNRAFTVFEESALNDLDLGVSDADGDSLTVRIDTLPANGQLFRTNGTQITAGSTLSLNSDVVRYTPNPGHTGADSFTFSATDAPGESSPVRTASITLIAEPAGKPALAAGDDTGQDRDGNGTVDAEPAGLIINGLAVDKVTSVTNGLSFSFDAPNVNSVAFVVRDPVTLVELQNVAGVQAGNTYSANLNLTQGTFDIIARSTIGNNSRDSEVLRLNVDNTDPAQPGVTLTNPVAVNKGSGNVLTNDITPQFSLSAVEENGMIIVERADHGSAVFTELGRLSPASANGIVSSFTDTTLTQRGTYTYRFKQVDIAGNDPATVVTVVVDNVAPAISNLTVNGQTPPPATLLDQPQPTFQFTVTDDTYVAFDNPLLVELIDGNTNTVLASTTLANPAGADGTFTQNNVTLTPNSPLAPGRYALRVRVTDSDLAALGAASSTTTSAAVTVTVSSADTQGAPGTPVYGRIYDLRQIGPQPNGTGGPVLLADGTPVNFRGSHVWQTSFDKTTQTVWVNFEHGLATGVNDTVFSENGLNSFTIPRQNPATMQFDPATGQFKLFDYKTIFGDDAVLLNNTNPATDARNPHGNSFDFDTHVNPRIWVAHRNAAPSSPGAQPGNQPGNVGGDGRISYIEVRPGADGKHRVVTYDLSGLAGVELTDMHAAFVDAQGTVWFTSAETSSVVEVNFDVQSNPVDPLNPDAAIDSPNIDSSSALVKVHSMPIGSLTGEGPGGAHSEFHGHAVKTIVDDQTGERYVWLASVGGKGQVALLRPGAGTNGEDVWTTWDVPAAAGTTAQNARVPFVEIDDNETPGDPSDDRVIFVAPVTGAEGTPGAVAGIVQVLNPGIVPGDPTAPTSANMRVYQVNGLTGGFAAVNQPYLDREGGIYWIDRLTGVGRIDVEPAQEVTPSPSGVSVAARQLTNTVADEFFIDETAPVPRVAPVVGFAKLDKSQPSFNEATQAGVNQYRVLGSNPIATDDIPNGLMGARGQGLGPFRGAINAGNVIYGAHTTQDEFSAAVFAETTRRQMSVVRTSDTLTAGALVEGRMAFQTVRTRVDSTSQEQVGAVIMTHRVDGQILDQQINLTSLVAQQTGRNPEDIAMDSDVAAVRDSADNVYVVGKGGSLDLIVYRFTAATSTWDVLEFGDGMQVLPGEPVARIVVDPLTQQERLVAFASNSKGRLLLFDGAAAPTDLTPGALTVENTPQAIYGYLTVAEDAGGGYSVYAVNQQGGFVAYSLNADLSLNTGPTVQVVNSAQDALGNDLFDIEEIRVLQGLSVVDVAGVRHLFSNDGLSRLVHLTLEQTGDWTAENVTQLTKATAAGYFSFQQAYAARIYSEISLVQDAATGNLYIYGTNGGELVEFAWDGTTWAASNLTNDMTRSPSPVNRDRVTANAVFGAPDVYLAPDGSRHVLQINGDSEVVEYILHRNGDFSTQNVNLARGSDIADLREFTTAPAIRFPAGPALYAQNGTPSILDPTAVLVDNLVDLTNKTIIIRVVNWQAGDQIGFEFAPAGPAPAVNASVFAESGAVQIGTYSHNHAVEQNRATVTLNGNATAARVQDLLRQIQFSQSAVNPATLGSRLIDISIADSSGATLTNIVKALAVLTEGTLDTPIDGTILG